MFAAWRQVTLLQFSAAPPSVLCHTWPISLIFITSQHDSLKIWGVGELFSCFSEH